jgi:glycosyltransferase involved in cell wall biosynthesis
MPRPRAAVALYFCRLAEAGGAERRIIDLAGALAARGYEVHLLSLDPPEARAFYPIPHGVTWHRLSCETGLAGKSRRVAAIVSTLRAGRIKALIGFVMSGDKTIYAAARLAGIALVAAERNGPSMRYGAAERLTSLALLHLCDAIAVQFPEYAEEYPPSLRRRMACIPNPVAPSPVMAVPHKAGRDGRFRLLSVGRLDGVQKRLDCLIEAFATVAAERPDWDLAIAGDGPYKARLRTLISDRGLGDRVRLLPATQDVYELYAQAHLFVIPSLWEGFPNALAEAMSAGLPAVGFRQADGVAQLIAEGRTGWLAGDGEPVPRLAAALAAAMADGDERRLRGLRAAKAMTRYAPEEQYDKWASLIDNVISRGAA